MASTTPQILTHDDCLEGPDGCRGAVEYRMPLSGTGVPFPRCETHWAQRLDRQRDADERYPAIAPADFDAAYAGERWDED